jgi:hypothetical protein
MRGGDSSRTRLPLRRGDTPLPRFKCETETLLPVSDAASLASNARRRLCFQSPTQPPSLQTRDGDATSSLRRPASLAPNARWGGFVSAPMRQNCPETAPCLRSGLSMFSCRLLLVFYRENTYVFFLVTVLSVRLYTRVEYGIVTGQGYRLGLRVRVSIGVVSAMYLSCLIAT